MSRESTPAERLAQVGDACRRGNTYHALAIIDMEDILNPRHRVIVSLWLCATRMPSARRTRKGGVLHSRLLHVRRGRRVLSHEPATRMT